MAPNLTNHECYVSLEVAKLLKEAGFKWFINSAYRDGVLMYQKNLLCDNFNGKRYEKATPHEFFSAPTLDVAQRWLREVNKMCIVVFPVENRFTFMIVKLGEKFNQDDYILEYNTYEEAQEESIKRTLEIMLEKVE